MLSDTGVMHELIESRKALERLTGATVEGFAYPAGFCDDRIIQAVAEAGYRYAVGTKRGLNRGHRNPFLIERMGAPDTGMADFKRCVASLTRASSQG
jgi:peptidoglycan/xylan/chitin deacetylase (PgdA/CDA1 family)